MKKNIIKLFVVAVLLAGGSFMSQAQVSPGVQLWRVISGSLQPVNSGWGVQVGDLTVTGTCTGCGGGSGFDYGTNIYSQTSAATSSALEINSTGTSTFAGGVESWTLVSAPSLNATSTTATSTFSGGFTTGASGITAFANGFVGIGTTSPYAPLSVVGTGGVVAENYTATGTATSTFNGGLAVETSGLVYDYSTNKVGIGTTTPYSAMLNIDSGTGSGLRTFSRHSGGTTFEIEAINEFSSNADSVIAATGYGTNVKGTFIGRSARGTFGSPTALQSGDEILFIGARGYHSGDAFPSLASADVIFEAAENFTSTAQGTDIYFETAPIGSVTKAERLRISSGGTTTITSTLSAAQKEQLVLNNAATAANTATGLIFANTNNIGINTNGLSKFIFTRQSDGSNDFNLLVSPGGAVAPTSRLTIDGSNGSTNHLGSATGQLTMLKLTNLAGQANDTSDIDFSISTGGTTLGRFSAYRTNRAVTGDTDFIWSLFSNSSLSEAMRLKDNGNLGIGTTTPNWKLQVVNTTAPQLALTDSGAGTNLKHWTMRSAGGSLYFATSTDAYATSTKAALSIDPNGLTTFLGRFRGGRQTLLQFTAADNDPPSTNFATFDTRNDHPVLTFGSTATSSAMFKGIMPQVYGGNGVSVILHFAQSTSTITDSVNWSVAFERLLDGTDDLDNWGFAATTTVTATPNGTSGVLATATLNFAEGTAMDSVAIGDTFRISVARDLNDTSSTTQQLLSVEIREQ